MIVYCFIIINGSYLYPKYSVFETRVINDFRNWYISKRLAVIYGLKGFLFYFTKYSPLNFFQVFASLVLLLISFITNYYNNELFVYLNNNIDFFNYIMIDLLLHICNVLAYQSLNSYSHTWFQLEANGWSGREQLSFSRTCLVLQLLYAVFISIDSQLNKL